MPLDATAQQASMGPQLLLQTLGMAGDRIDRNKQMMMQHDGNIAQYLISALQQYGGMKQREDDVAFRDTQVEYQKGRDAVTDKRADREFAIKESLAGLEAARMSGDLEAQRFHLDKLNESYELDRAAKQASIDSARGQEGRAADLHNPMLRSANTQAEAQEFALSTEKTDAPMRSNLLATQAVEARDGMGARVGLLDKQNVLAGQQIDLNRAQAPALAAQPGLQNENIRANTNRLAAESKKLSAEAAGIGPGGVTADPLKMSESVAKFMQSVRSDLMQDSAANAKAIGELTDLPREEKAARIAKINAELDKEVGWLAEFEREGMKVQRLIAEGGDAYTLWRVFRAAKHSTGTFDWEALFPTAEEENATGQVPQPTTTGSDISLMDAVLGGY